MELDFYVPTGLMIKEYLDMTGMSIPELAGKIGINENNMQNILESIVPLTENVAEEISKVFGIDPKYFIEYEKGYRDFLVKHNA